MADYQAFAAFFAVTRKPPMFFDDLIDPKLFLTNVCLRSRNRAMKEGVPPRPRSGRKVGPEYVAAIRDFTNQEWSVERARVNSPSLERAWNGLVRLRLRLEDQTAP